MTHNTPHPANKPVEKAGIDSGTKTLRHILNVVSESRDLKERHRRRLLSAVRMAAQGIGRDPSDIPAQPAALQKALGEVNYRQAGFTKERWRDIRSLTLTALQLGGVKLMPGRRHRSQFTPAWTALRRGTSSSFQIGLSRFMNFCCADGIEPSQVNAAVFANFGKELNTKSLVRDPGPVYRETCRLWDRASERYDGWPVFKIGVPPSTYRYSLPLDAYPASFVADIEAFMTSRSEPGFAIEDFEPVRPATATGRRKSIRLLATALASSGFPIEQITALEVLTRPDNAWTIMKFFWDRAGKKKKEHVYSLACLLRVIGRYWVKHPAHIKKLDEICTFLKIKNHGMTERNRNRLRQFDDERNVAALLMLPAKLASMSRQHDNGGENSPTLAMYAAAIEILTAAPVRISNLVNLRIGHSVLLPQDANRRNVVISIPREEVKNDTPLEFELPRESSDFIFRYLKEYRPRLSTTPSDFLFPNEAGSKRNVSAFSRRLSSLILAHSGLEMHSHLFRHLAVKLLLAENPDALETARRLLGHKSIVTTSRAYSEGKNKVAHQRYTNMIEGKRNTFKPSGDWSMP